MEFSISSKVWAEPGLTSSEKMVLLALDHLGDRDGFSWNGYDKLSEVTGISADSKYLTKIINKLEKDGYILIWRQHGRRGGRGYTHIYWPIIGRADEEILEIVTRRFAATPDEASAIISQNGLVYQNLVKDNRVSGDKLEQTRGIKKGVTITPIDPQKGVPETPNDNDGGTDYTQPDEKGVPEAPRSKESSSLESSPKKESKELSAKQKIFVTLAELCRINLKASTEKQRGQLGTTGKALIDLVTDLDQFKDKFPKYWKQIDWRGKQGQPPTPPQIQEVYGDYCHWLDNGEYIPAHPPNGRVKEPEPYLDETAVGMAAAMRAKARPRPQKG